jgi:hypothetical protein
MKSVAWLKRVSIGIALFAAGAAAGDFAVRGGKSAQVSQAAAPPVQVVHKRRVRTVHVHPQGGAMSATPAAAPAAAPAASTAAPMPVTSRTSPAAGGAGGGGEGTGEAEGAD